MASSGGRERETGPTVRSVVKAIEIMELLSFEKENWGTREIASRLKLSPSSASRLLQTLRNKGMVNQDPVSQRYGPGPNLFRMAAALSSRNSLKNVALPVMAELVKECGETSYLCALVSDQYVILEKVECSHPIRFFLNVGSLHSLHAGAAGKAILAYLDDDGLGRIFSRELPRLTARTLVGREELLADLKETQRRGYAFSHGERVPGAVGVAAPVFDRAGVVGSLVVTIPQDRFHQAELASLAGMVMGAAEKISHQLGHYDGKDGQRRRSLT